jgi:AraC family transcriptional regulator
MALGQDPIATREATIIVDAELRGQAAVAQIVRYDIPAPTESTLADPDCYQINLCLTPRPLNARAC